MERQFSLTPTKYIPLTDELHKLAQHFAAANAEHIKWSTFADLTSIIILPFTHRSTSCSVTRHCKAPTVLRWIVHVYEDNFGDHSISEVILSAGKCWSNNCSLAAEATRHGQKATGNG